MPPRFDKKAMRQQREAAGLTQSQLGRLVGRDGDYISKVERGDRRPGKTTKERILQELSATANGLATRAWTEEEQRLLYLFRRLPEDIRSQIMGFVKAMILRIYGPSHNLSDLAADLDAALEKHHPPRTSPRARPKGQRRRAKQA